VPGGIAGERGDETHGRFVVEPCSCPGPWVLLATADNEFEVTSQDRLDQLFAAQTVQAAGLLAAIRGVRRRPIRAVVGFLRR